MTGENQTKQECWPKVLPMVYLGTKTWFVDLRLRQFRDVSDPYDYVDFASDRGRQMCDQANIISCPDCGARFIVPGVWRHTDLTCVLCMASLNEYE